MFLQKRSADSGWDCICFHRCSVNLQGIYHLMLLFLSLVGVLQWDLVKNVQLRSALQIQKQNVVFNLQSIHAKRTLNLIFIVYAYNILLVSTKAYAYNFICSVLFFLPFSSLYHSSCLCFFLFLLGRYTHSLSAMSYIFTGIKK